MFGQGVPGVEERPARSLAQATLSRGLPRTIGATNSGCRRKSFFGFEELEYTSGEESLQVAPDLSVRLAFGAPALDVASGLFVTGLTNEH